ncbi:MAG: hypothetical protein FD165_2208 [Gammaproteobacteria bacterium]|nr:MAG: hypothetical protein FD165_2208 [Gammaproteobacteria bacterium]TND03268.1 MAG: hypothetical protein FD120_1941 [Gammaproteobacteria bacterium]
MDEHPTQAPVTHWPVLAGLAVLAVVAVMVIQSKMPASESAGWRPGWQAAAPFDIPRRALAAVAAPAPSPGISTNAQNAHAYLYVIGGVDNSGHYVRDTEYAPILPDGSLGPWRKTSALAEDRFYLAAATLNGYLYAAGGGQGDLGSDNLPVASVERAKILPDGGLEPWERAAYMTTPRRGLKLVTHDNYLYAIGGYNGAFLKSTERAPLLPDGSLGEWLSDPELSVVDRYIHSAAIRDDTVYLVGGHVQGGNTMSYGDVESSRTRRDGSLSPWQVEETFLKMPRFIASSFALRDFIYILGGHDGAQRLSSVEFASLDANGHVGPWTFTADMRSPRSATSLAVYNDTVYVLGGMGESGALNTVESARQLRDGHLGYHPVD